MILPINILVIFLLLNTFVFGEKVEYKIDGKYKMLSNKHLINDVNYKNDGLYQVLVEIPTGSLQKWEVGHTSGHIEWEFKNGKPREVNFLGYPGNYGFIPQTRSGDGDPLDIIVLSESARRGEILTVNVIGMLKLEDTGEEDTKILAITNDGPFKNIDTLKDMLIKYPNMVPIVKEWFEGYKGPGLMLFKGYEDKEATIKHIENAHKKWLQQKF